MYIPVHKSNDTFTDSLFSDNYIEGLGLIS